jgi:hypothetical protein
MTGRHFYDWQTAGGADNVMRTVDALERTELHWRTSGAPASPRLIVVTMCRR